MAVTEGACVAQGGVWIEDQERCDYGGGAGSSTGFQGAVTLTLDQIRAEIGLLNDQIAERYPDATEDELTAYQQQAYAEFIEMAKADRGVNVTPTFFAQALNQNYDDDFVNLYFRRGAIGDKNPLGLGYSQTVTTGTDAWNTWLADNPYSEEAGVAQTTFGTGTAAKSWVPQMVTRGGTRDAAGNLILGGVRSPTDYELMTGAQLAPFLPTAPYDVTKIAQNTPAYTAAGTLPTDLFDPIGFPERPITRGTPVVTRGFDAAGNPTTGITMGQSTAAPTGANIGQLTTAMQLPTTGMHIASTGLGGTTVGTMPTTGNIVSTGADEITQWVDENGVLQTSSIAPAVINTGEEETVLVTPTEVELDEVPGSVAYCALYPDTAVCIAGTAEFCALAGNLNDPSCDPAKTCLSGEELWNGICLAICGVNETRDSTGICQSNDLGNCPVGTDQPGVRIPDGETVAWCTFPKCPDGTERQGVTIPVGAAANWCDIPEPDPTCPLGTDRENQTIPAGKTTTWCSTAPTCPAGTVKENQTIPDDETEASWCDTGAAETTITCYDETGQFPSQEVTGVNPSCPVGWSTTDPTDPYAAAKVACADAGGTWDDTTDPESCTAAAITTCPAGTLRETETIPDGETVAWCDIAAVVTCATGTDKAGLPIPAGQNSAWCNCGVGYEWDADIQDCKLKGATRGACPVGTDKAGLAIPADQDIASWCNCGEGYTWNAETKKCDLAAAVDPYAADKADCETAGGTWNTTTNSCDEAPDPYAADKAACTNTGGTWDDTTDPQTCIPATVVPTCPATSTNNAGQPIPDNQTLDSFCCPEGMAWNASSNQCEVVGTAITNVCATGTLRAGAAVPTGEPATWCDVACPTGETWDTEALACAAVDPYAAAKVACADAGGTWDDTTEPESCAAAVDPYAAAKVTCADAGGTWNDTTEPQSCDAAVVVDPWAADKVDCANSEGTWNTTTNNCDAAAVDDPYAANKAVCANTVGGATWDDVNNICVPATLENRFATEKAACAAIGSSHRWDEGYMACVPVGDLTGLVGSELLDQTYAYQTALSTDPVGTYTDPYSMGPGYGVVAAKGPKAPAIPANLGQSNVPGIFSINFGDGQLTGGFGGPTPSFGAPSSYAPGGYGPGFAHGGEVEDRHRQRQDAVGSRLMRHAGLGQFADQIGDEMLSTIERIMDRKD